MKMVSHKIWWRMVNIFLLMKKLQIKVLLYISKNYLSQIHVYQFIIEWKKADGSLVPFEFDTSGLDLQSDGIINGQQEENPEIKHDGRLSFIHDADDRLPFELVAAGQKLDKIGIRDNDRPEGVATFVITNEEKDVLNSLLL